MSSEKGGKSSGGLSEMEMKIDPDFEILVDDSKLETDIVKFIKVNKVVLQRHIREHFNIGDKKTYNITNELIKKNLIKREAKKIKVCGHIQGAYVYTVK